ncbi:hypothetical protein Unana1_00538 [Umbelopsis nana]
MPAISKIVSNFQALRTGYEEDTGQALSQEPIHSSQWQLQPELHLTQKYPYPVKDQSGSTSSNDNQIVSVAPTVTPTNNANASAESLAAEARSNIAVVASQAEGLYGVLSQPVNANIQVAGWVDEEEDGDATQIPQSQMHYHFTVSSPDLPNEIYTLSADHSNGSVQILSTFQSSDFSMETGADPSPNFWQEPIRRDSTSSVKSYVILGTYLPRSLSQTEFNRLVHRLNGQVADTFSPEVTHIVTTVDEKKLARRTLKYLQGMVCGKWILDASWLEKSILAGKFVDEDEYEVLGDETSDHLSVPCTARQSLNTDVSYDFQLDGRDTRQMLNILAV